jgi:ubiquinone/menaquinone biosynthesis C-methylase UbiE
MGRTNKKHPFKFAARTARLFLSRSDRTAELVATSYDQLSAGYDETWTSHMRDKTRELIDRLDIAPGHNAIDLTCGTGYATNLIAEKTKQTVLGVDMSEGMLQEARSNYANSCDFVNADILTYLKHLPPDTFDIVTCCWGLGYSRPLAVLRQIKRILKPRGKVGIIDNTIFSLREIMYCSVLAFAEHPEKLQNLMRFRFLTGPRQLRLWTRLSGMKHLQSWSGQKSYTVQSGAEAIERLQATGAAAGFEFAASPEDSKQIFERFAEIIEKKYLRDNEITVTHRYLAGIGTK